MFFPYLINGGLFKAHQAALDTIPTMQHIPDNYDILTTEEKNRLWKLVLKKATLYRIPQGELSVHIYIRSFRDKWF